MEKLFTNLEVNGEVNILYGVEIKRIKCCDY
jgi:hypothetical protein